MKKDKATLSGLFSSFFKITSLTLGGGAVMLPLMEEEFVQKRQWISENEMLDVYSLCNTLPGVIALNSSLIIGRMCAGFPGALCSVCGVLLPSIMIITLLATAIQLFSGNATTANAFLGVRAGVAALLLFVLIKLGKKTIKGVREAGIAIFAFICLESFSIHPLLIILLSAGLGFWLFRKDKS